MTLNLPLSKCSMHILSFQRSLDQIGCVFSFWWRKTLLIEMTDTEPGDPVPKHRPAFHTDSQWLFMTCKQVKCVILV